MVVKSLVANPHIDSNELAFILFPQNLHPRKALSRLCNESASQANRRIKEDQIKRLAVYLGVSMGELFSDACDWVNFHREKAISFTKGDKLIMIELNSNTGYVFKLAEPPIFFRLGIDNALIEAIHQIETKF